MKKNILLITFMLFVLACETGKSGDKNVIKQKSSQSESYGAGMDEKLEYLFDNKEMSGDPYYVEKDSIAQKTMKEKLKTKEHVDFFSSAVITHGLELRKVREGEHKGYIRLVFDVYNDAKPATIVGHYDVKYSHSRKNIAINLHGYQKFTAPLPFFSPDSLIEQIYFDQNQDSSGLKFHIKLRRDAKVKVFDLKNPARIVFDIKAI